MNSSFFSFSKIPDLTLAQYSAEESGGVDAVVKQHGSFYRQLNRKGQLFKEDYSLIYYYDPCKTAGNRMKGSLRVDSNNMPERMEEFLNASPLSPYFHFESDEPDLKLNFNYKVTLAKADYFVESSLLGSDARYYVVNQWKPNESARLMGLFRMMKSLDTPVAYSVSIRAVDCSMSLKNSFNSQIQYIKQALKINTGIKDDNADMCLKLYDKFFESLRSNPHFICKICAYSNDEAAAKMVIDAAASESVEEGNYRLFSTVGNYNPYVPDNMLEKSCIESTPRGMEYWNQIFLLKELIPFAVLPTLYPGETIEIPKESAPLYEKSGLFLGKDNSGYDVYFPLKLLPKHALLAGVPGSGKTYSMLHLSSELAGNYQIPILVLEPAKKEYRALAHNPKMNDLLVFSPGAPGSFPLRINPFEFPIGLKLSEHITNLNMVFEGAFDLTPPMPFLVSESIEKVYRDHGWYPFDVNDGSKTYPNISELYDKVAELLDASDYAAEVKSNLKSCLQVRLGSLVTREMGNVFNVPGSTYRPEEWLCKKCVIELESLGPDAANFLTLLLLTLIRELLRQNPNAPKDKPRHVIFLEEAHNLIGPSTVANAENGDAKVASTKYIVDMLAEVRALREAIIIADQLPTGLAPQVTKNTSLKLAHRITAMDDRQLLASTMSADGVQLERMGTFQPGHTLCSYEMVQKPFELQVNEYRENSTPPDNNELYSIFSQRPDYNEVMHRDYKIMGAKFRIKYNNDVKPLRDLCKQSKNAYINAFMMLETNNDSKFAPAYMKQYSRNATNFALANLELIMEFINYVAINQNCIEEGMQMISAFYEGFKNSLEELFVCDLKPLAQPYIDKVLVTIGQTFG